MRGVFLEWGMQENTWPWVIKVVPAVVGAILALVLSGDISIKMEK